MRLIVLAITVLFAPLYAESVSDRHQQLYREQQQRLELERTRAHELRLLATVLSANPQPEPGVRQLETHARQLSVLERALAANAAQLQQYSARVDELSRLTSLQQEKLAANAAQLQQYSARVDELSRLTSLQQEKLAQLSVDDPLVFSSQVAALRAELDGVQRGLKDRVLATTNPPVADRQQNYTWIWLAGTALALLVGLVAVIAARSRVGSAVRRAAEASLHERAVGAVSANERAPTGVAYDAAATTTRLDPALLGLKPVTQAAQACGTTGDWLKIDGVLLNWNAGIYAVYGTPAYQYVDLNEFSGSGGRSPSRGNC